MSNNNGLVNLEIGDGTVASGNFSSINWSNGPFKAMDEIGPSKIIEKLKSEGKELPHMLKILEESSSENFYNNKGQQLSHSGEWITL